MKRKEDSFTSNYLTTEKVDYPKMKDWKSLNISISSETKINPFGPNSPMLPYNRAHKISNKKYKNLKRNRNLLIS